MSEELPLFNQPDIDRLVHESFLASGYRSFVRFPRGKYHNGTFPSRSSFENECVFMGSTRFGSRANISQGSVLSDIGTFRFEDHAVFRPGVIIEDARNLVLSSNTRFHGGAMIHQHRIRDGQPYAYLSLSGAGAALRTTQFFNCDDGIYVTSGCFFGSLTQFRNAVDDDCPDIGSDLSANQQIKRYQYMGMANIAAMSMGRPDLIINQ